MPKYLKFTLVAGALLATATLIPARAAASRDALVARGRYIVESVGMCADCHTARNEHGEFIKERWLKGTQLPFTPAVPMPWSPVSPQIAGLPTMTEEQAAKFLQTGVRPNGSQPLPPMPAFRFNAADASAVAAYLKSLAP